MSGAPPYSEAELAQARRHVAALRGFYIHATVYCGVIGLLFVINFLTGRPWWFVWPAIGWGIGLAFHAFGVYGKDTLFGREWEERKVREYLDQQRNR
jgi:hypothetical protein